MSLLPAAGGHGTHLRHGATQTERPVVTFVKLADEMGNGLAHLPGIFTWRSSVRTPRARR